MATACVVSSLHDGMNLVAKEFVAARADLRGVLVLSRFTGAAQDLTDALLVNPFAMDDFAEALHQALQMPEDQQEQRMRRMRQQVTDNNIYRWAGMLLSEASKLLASRPGAANGKLPCDTPFTHHGGGVVTALEPDVFRQLLGGSAQDSVGALGEFSCQGGSVK